MLKSYSQRGRNAKKYGTNILKRVSTVLARNHDQIEYGPAVPSLTIDDYRRLARERCTEVLLHRKDQL